MLMGVIDAMTDIAWGQWLQASLSARNGEWWTKKQPSFLPTSTACSILDSVPGNSFGNNMGCAGMLLLISIGFCPSSLNSVPRSSLRFVSASGQRGQLARPFCGVGRLSFGHVGRTSLLDAMAGCNR